MKIINIEAGVFEEMMNRLETFVDKIDELCRKGRDRNLQKWLENQDVCEILSISKRTLQTYRDNGTLPYSRIGNKMYYKADDIKKLLPFIADKPKGNNRK